MILAETLYVINMTPRKQHCSKRPKLALLTHKDTFVLLIWLLMISQLEVGRAYLLTDRLEKIKIDRGDGHLLEITGTV